MFKKHEISRNCQATVGSLRLVFQIFSDFKASEERFRMDSYLHRIERKRLRKRRFFEEKDGILPKKRENTEGVLPKENG